MPDDVADLTARLKATAATFDALVDLNIDAFADLKVLIASLEAPRSAGELDLSGYGAKAITAALLRLDDRRPALVRTWTNSGLEARRGRRNGGIGGAPKVPNGNGRSAEIGA